MTVIKVPQPPASALDLNRPISSLLKNQIRHLQEAEFRLPVRSQTNTYINAIKTEGEAADYIRKVTLALKKAHARRKPKPSIVSGLAAGSEKTPARKKVAGPASRRSNRKKK